MAFKVVSDESSQGPGGGARRDTATAPATGVAGTAYAVRSLVRGLSIIRCFDVDHPQWSLTDLARQTALNKVTVYRLVKTLEAEGFLHLDPATGKYHLGAALIPVAYLGLSHSELVRIARPHLEWLASATGETADLAVWTGQGTLFIAQVSTSRPFKPASFVGRIFYDHGNAHSKVFIASLPEDKRAEILAQPAERLTPFTITDPARFAEEINAVASEGIAHDRQEQTLGICGVAAPIRDFAGSVVASLSVAVPEERSGPDETNRYISLLKEAAQALSRDLGYRG